MTSPSGTPWHRSSRTHERQTTLKPGLHPLRLPCLAHLSFLLLILHKVILMLLIASHLLMLMIPHLEGVLVREFLVIVESSFPVMLFLAFEESVDTPIVNDGLLD